MGACVRVSVCSLTNLMTVMHQVCCPTGPEEMVIMHNVHMKLSALAVKLLTSSRYHTRLQLDDLTTASGASVSLHRDHDHVCGVSACVQFRQSCALTSTQTYYPVFELEDTWGQKVSRGIAVRSA